ncbi:MAG TPA: alpha/beta fold hydrolase [Pyrinomonadaceae bacterium]|nr:alpha/beta fold hydrolase [Pyrinomonadaceae bacterium]
MAKASIRGIEIGYDEVGTGTPVVLLHGYPFNRSMWSEQIEVLSARHRVLAPDLRGHGETSATTQPATMEEMAKDVAELMEKLNISRAAVCGLSMGGYVALALYRMFPLRARALVLADTRPGPDTEEARANREVQAKKALEEGMAGIADAMLPKLLAPNTVAKNPGAVARVRDMMLKTKPEGAAAALRGMAQRRDQTSFLSRVVAPALIVVGSEDMITPVSESELMHREIGGSRLKVIEGAGHVSNIEQTENFNHVLSTFLRDLEV